VSKTEEQAKAAGDAAAVVGCEPCKGTGKIAGMNCPQCKGSGKANAPAPDPVADSASSLTALLSPSKKVGSASDPPTLETVLSNIMSKGRK
jgi:RecJ-like exonuclease